MTMLAWLTAALLAGASVAAAAATRVPVLERAVRVSTGVLEVLVVLVVVVDLGLVLPAEGADRPESMLTHVGYAVAAVGLLPMLTWRHPAAEDPDPEPVSLWVVAIALLAVAVCVLRLVATR